MSYYVYLVECSDESLYCGYTNDLDKRVESHNNAKYGSKYTRSRLPVKLIYSEHFESKSGAMKREYEIKKLTRLEKLELINSYPRR